jgi:hypothetical protein
MVSVSLHMNITGTYRMIDDDDIFDRGTIFEGHIHIFLKGNPIPTPPSPVCRNKELRTTVVDAITKSVRTKTAEDDCMRGSYTGTS